MPSLRAESPGCKASSQLRGRGRGIACAWIPDGRDTGRRLIHRDDWSAGTFRTLVGTDDDARKALLRSSLLAPSLEEDCAVQRYAITGSAVVGLAA